MKSGAVAALTFAAVACIRVSSALPLFPGPDKWDEIPNSRYQVLYDREMVITEPRDPPKAVLFTLHGCLQTVTQWGFKSPSCPVCDGMPEEMLTVYNAVKRGYAVVAMGPHRVGDVYGCFNTTWPPKGYYELPQMTQNIRHLLKEKNWWDLPWYALGSSRGGEMAMSLALRFPLQGVASIVMGLRNETLETDMIPMNENTNETFPYPPVLFMRARNDQLEVQEALDITIPTMEERGIYVEEYMMEPYPITPTFFSQRLRGVDEGLSEILFRRLQTKGLVDMEGWSQFGNWTDAKEGGWELAIWEMEIALHHFFWPEWKRAHYDRAFKEMLWASEAIHEQNAQYIDYILDFFERTTTPQARFLNGTTLNETHPWVLSSDEYDIMLKDPEDPNKKKEEKKPWNWWGAIDEEIAQPLLVKPASDKPSAKAASDKPSVKPASDKPSAKAATDKPSVEAASDKPSAKDVAEGGATLVNPTTDKPAEERAGDPGAGVVKAGAQKASEKGAGDGGGGLVNAAGENPVVNANAGEGEKATAHGTLVKAAADGVDATVLDLTQVDESKLYAPHHHHHAHKNAREMTEHVPASHHHHHAKNFASAARSRLKHTRQEN